MKERPIIFCSDMVRAILEGRKWQTMRVCNPALWLLLDEIKKVNGHAGWQCLDFDVKCPFDMDRLWVKETWRVGAWNHDLTSIAVDYKADGCCRKEWLLCPDEEQFERLWMQSTDDAAASGLMVDEDSGEYHWRAGESPCRWRPSMFMPRWASRLNLTVKAVRVERVQDISEEDAIAEGVTLRGCTRYEGEARAAFRKLWESINAKRGYGWDVNPWVFVISFDRLTPSGCYTGQYDGAYRKAEREVGR